jgi:hypothetical protein
VSCTCLCTTARLSDETYVVSFRGRTFTHHLLAVRCSLFLLSPTSSARWVMTQPYTSISPCPNQARQVASELHPSHLVPECCACCVLGTDASRFLTRMSRSLAGHDVVPSHTTFPAACLAVVLASLYIWYLNLPSADVLVSLSLVQMSVQVIP